MVLSLPVLPLPTSGPRAPAPWPSLGLARTETLVADADERVVEGVPLASAAPVIMSMRDLGEDVSASLWDDEVRRLGAVSHPCAAPVVSARVHADRVVVLATARPDGEPLRARLRHGPLAPATATVVLRDALRLMVHLHGLGLSAAGAWLRAGVLVGPPAARRFVMTTFGLRVDNLPDPRAELHELATRLLVMVGGRAVRGALAWSADALEPRAEAAVRRALADLRPFDSARAMLDALSG